MRDRPEVMGCYPMTGDADYHQTALPLVLPPRGGRRG